MMTMEHSKQKTVESVQIQSDLFDLIELNFRFPVNEDFYYYFLFISSTKSNGLCQYASRTIIHNELYRNQVW